jgi:hypothetical protein
MASIYNLCTNRVSKLGIMAAEAVAPPAADSCIQSLPEWVIKLRLSAWWSQQLNEIPSLSTMPIDLIHLISGYARSSIIVAFGRESPYYPNMPHKSVIAISVDEPEPTGWVTLPHLKSCIRSSPTCFTINDIVYAAMGAPHSPSRPNSFEVWDGAMDRLAIDDQPMLTSYTKSSTSTSSFSSLHNNNSITRGAGHEPFQWYQHAKQSRSSSVRLYSCHLTMNDQLYVISGSSPFNSNRAHALRSDIEQYDPNDDEYTPNAIPPLPHPSNLASATQCGDYIYVGDTKQRSIIDRYHIPTRQWLTIPSFINDPNLLRVSYRFDSSIITIPRCHQCMPTSNATEVILFMGSNEKEVIVYDPTIYNASSHGYE